MLRHSIICNEKIHLKRSFSSTHVVELRKMFGPVCYCEAHGHASVWGQYIPCKGDW